MPKRKAGNNNNDNNDIDNNNSKRISSSSNNDDGNNKKGFYEERLERAIRMVISYKWSQKAVSQAFNIPRQTLADRLKKETNYSSRCSYKGYPKSALVEAMRLVLEESIPLATAASRCGVPKATLYCRLKGNNTAANVDTPTAVDTSAAPKGGKRRRTLSRGGHSSTINENPGERSGYFVGA